MLGIENNHTVFSEMRFSLANSDRGAGDAFEPVRGFLSYCFSLILSLCSPLAAEVSLQHCGHREGKDQTDSVGSGAARPVGPDQLSQEVSVTGNELPSVGIRVTHDTIPETCKEEIWHRKDAE